MGSAGGAAFLGVAFEGAAGALIEPAKGEAHDEFAVELLPSGGEGGAREGQGAHDAGQGFGEADRRGGSVGLCGGLGFGIIDI